MSRIWCLTFSIRESLCFIIKSYSFIKARIKAKITNRVLEFNQSQLSKPYVEFNTQKRIESEKNDDKDGKALYKLMNHAVYGKTMENMKNKIDVRLVSNEKDFLKRISKPNYMSKKIFDTEFVAIRKNKVTLKVNKLGYVGICLLDLSLLLMYEFH